MEPIPKEEEGNSIAKTPPSTFQYPAVEPKPPTPNPPKEEEIQPLKFPFEIEDGLFFDFGNASNQFVRKKSSTPKAPNLHIPTRLEEHYLKETIQELTSIMSNEWLKEAKTSSSCSGDDSFSSSGSSS